MADIRGKGIARLYQTGGANLLAFRLGQVFTKIENEADKVRHNDMVADVLNIINDEAPKPGELSRAENSMLMFIARLLMERRLRRSKRKNKFLLTLGEWILHKGQEKGQ